MTVHAAVLIAHLASHRHLPQTKIRKYPPVSKHRVCLDIIIVVVL
jgi:hypothetical protein